MQHHTIGEHTKLLDDINTDLLVWYADLCFTRTRCYALRHHCTRTRACTQVVTLLRHPANWPSTSTAWQGVAHFKSCAKKFLLLLLSHLACPPARMHRLLTQNHQPSLTFCNV
jgi:hypothetical protein